MYSTTAPSILAVSRQTGRKPKPVSPVEMAGPTDFQDLVHFLRMMREEIICDDDDILITTAANLVTQNGGFVLVVRGSGREPIEASMGIRFAKMAPLSRQYQMQSVWNLVIPERRARTGHAKSLLLEAKKMEVALGVPIFVDEWGTPDLPKNKLVSRHLNLVRVMFSTESPFSLTEV